MCERCDGERSHRTSSSTPTPNQRVQRRHVEGRSGAVHLAGQSEEQDCAVLEPADVVQVSVADERPTTARERVATTGGAIRSASSRGDWTEPATSRLLLEAGALYQLEQWGWFPYDDLSAQAIRLDRAERRHQLQSAHRLYRKNYNDTFRYRVAASYVTGAHSVQGRLQQFHWINGLLRTGCSTRCRID